VPRGFCNITCIRISGAHRSGSTKVVMGPSQCFYIPCPAAVPSGPGSQSPEQEVVIFFTHHLFLKALSGLSKQGSMFRNSYVTGHLCHEIATWPRKGLGVHRRAAISLKTKKTRDEATALLLLALSGTMDVTQPPGQAFRGSAGRPGHRAFY
jgi:hypothetical protein